MKTIIFVWKYNAINYDPTISFWGLGDIIRGIISVYQLCKKYNYEFIVDITNHKVSNYLEPIEHKYKNHIEENKNNISFILPEHIESFLQTTKYDIILLITNAFYVTPIEEDCKLFIKKLLTPTYKFYKHIQQQMNEKNITKYTITHARLGDGSMLRNEINMNIIYKFYKHVFNIRSPNQILISDSSSFKQFVKKEDNDIIMYDTKICHSGISSDDELRDTLFEFFLLINSEKIYSFSSYSWLSGFVNVAHVIYDIPIEYMLNL